MTGTTNGDLTDAPTETPAGYVDWHAAAKRNWIFDELLCGSEYSPVARPDLVMTKPWVMASVAANPTTLARTLDRTKDLMEPARPKIIHTHGAVAMIEFETFADSPFTGVLGAPPEGGAVGLVRMSLAVPPQGKGSITPGMGLKLLVDGKPSLDLLAMNHTVGQGRDFNLFSNTFSHDLRNEHEELRPPQKLMSWFFKRVSSQPRRLTIDHLAATRSDGSAITAAKVPTRIVFRPHRDVRRSVFANAQGEDFRDPLMRIGVGTNLWTVEAVGAGPDGSPLTIGVLRTTSRFCCSAGGERLFFRHHVSPADRVDR